MKKSDSHMKRHSSTHRTRLFWIVLVVAGLFSACTPSGYSRYFESPSDPGGSTDSLSIEEAPTSDEPAVGGYPKMHEPDDLPWNSETEPDSLVMILQRREYELSSMRRMVDSLFFQVDSLRQELDLAGSRVTISEDFVIPDTITFAGSLFNLRNERVFGRFEEIFYRELKSAHRWIPRSGMYFPVFDSLLSDTPVPYDVRYLAIAESNLNSLAESWVGAAGIWQFMKSTAKGYGMKIDEFVDERRNVFVATRAAARYLENAMEYLEKRSADDWLLAFCAYNAGPGNVSRVVNEQGGKTFFDLIQRVDETNQYVWRAVAIKMIFRYEEQIFGKRFERDPSLYDVTRIETLELKGHYKLDEWAKAQGTNVNRVWELNPWIKMYKRNRGRKSPVNDVVLSPGSYQILLPADAIPDETEVASIEKSFLRKNDGYFREYTVRKGDNLWGIARRFRMSVSKLKAINGLRSNTIYPGQKLKLFGNAGSTNVASAGSSSGRTYKVKSGDTISGISLKLGVSQAHLVRSNNLKTVTRNGKRVVIIRPGQVLKY